MRKAIPLSLALLAVALSGCSDELPSGSFSYQDHAIDLAGSAAVEYIAFNDPVASGSGGQVPSECQQDQLPTDPSGTAPDPFADQRCTQPETNIMVVFSALPDPQTLSYSVALAGGTSSPDKVLGTLTADMGGSYALNFTEAVDYGNDEAFDYTRLEVRLDAPAGPIPVGFASNAGGSQTFEVNEGLTSGVDFDATWTGKDLTLTVSGLNTNYTYDGWLIEDVDGTVEHSERFSVSNGEVTFKAPKNVGDYTGLHIHVAGTKVNVAVATIS